MYKIAKPKNVSLMQMFYRYLVGVWKKVLCAHFWKHRKSSNKQLRIESNAMNPTRAFLYVKLKKSSLKMLRYP